METEIISFVDCQVLAAPLTSKLLGNSQIPFNKFTPRKTLSFLDFGAVGLRPSVGNMTEVPTSKSFHAPFTGSDRAQETDEDVAAKSSKCESKEMEEDEQVEASCQHCSAAIEERIVKHLNKTTKYAFIFKLKKEEIKQVEKGDTSVLQTLFKSMTGDVALNAENFRIVPDRHLSAMMENIRKAANAFELEGSKKTQKQLELPVDKWILKSPRTAKVGVNQQTQCDERDGELDSDDSMKPIKYYLACRKAKNCDQCTQYEEQEVVRGHDGKRLSSDKCIQCKLVTSNGVGNSHRLRRAQLQMATKSTQYELGLCDELESPNPGEEATKSLSVPQDSLLIIRKKFCARRRQQTERLRAGEHSRTCLPDSVTFLPQRKPCHESEGSTMENDLEKMTSKTNVEGIILEISHEELPKMKTSQFEDDDNSETQSSAAGKSRGVVFGSFDVAEYPAETSPGKSFDTPSEMADNTCAIVNNVLKNLEVDEADANTFEQMLREDNFIAEFIEEHLRALRIDQREGEINFGSADNDLSEAHAELEQSNEEEIFPGSEHETNVVEVEKEVKDDVPKSLEIDKRKMEMELAKCHEILIAELLAGKQAVLAEAKIANELVWQESKSVPSSNELKFAENEEQPMVEDHAAIEVEPKLKRMKSSASKIPVLEQRNLKPSSSSEQNLASMDKVKTEKSNLSLRSSKIRLRKTGSQTSNATASPRTIIKTDNECEFICPTTSEVELRQESTSQSTTKIPLSEKPKKQTAPKPSRIPISIRRKSGEALKIRTQDGNLKSENVAAGVEEAKSALKNSEMHEWKSENEESLPTVSESIWETVDFPSRSSRSSISYYEKQRKLIELIVHGVEHELQDKSRHDFKN